MAVGVEEAQATVTGRISLGGSKYMYVGTLAFGTEYKTGGDVLGTAPGSPFTLPAKIDFLSFSGPMGSWLAEWQRLTNKIKVLWPHKEGEVLEEVTSKLNLSGVTAAPFMCIGS